MSKKELRSPDELMATSDHPLKAEIQELRKIIMAADPRLAERVKWNAPSYYFNVDLAAFNLRQTKFVQLIMLFPNGLVADPSGIMLGDWKDRRELRFKDMNEVNSRKDALQEIIKNWFTTIQ